MDRWLRAQNEGWKNNWKVHLQHILVIKKWNTISSEFQPDWSPSDKYILLDLDKKNYSGPSLKLLTCPSDLWVCIMSIETTDTANSK